MGRVEYDFRDGADGGKGVYHHEDDCTCKEFWGYLGYLIATWIYSAAFFALFLYAFLTDRVATFWTLITIWLAFHVFLIGGFMLPNLCKFYRERDEEERKKKEEIEKRERELHNHKEENQ